MEAFSDGVMAIIITIMVLELRVPEGDTLDALADVLPVALAYVLSFVYIGIYWNNHHHLFQVTRRTTGGIMWANLHLLFWLSLFPFATAWLGDTDAAAVPTATYGAVALASAIAYYVLQTAIVRAGAITPEAAASLGADLKGKVSPVLYAAAIPLAFVSSWISIAIFVAVALLWLVPDRRLEAGFAFDATGDET
jgi:uncharacterized membrane protein